MPTRHRRQQRLMSLFESSDDRYTALGPRPDKEVLGVLAKTSDGRNILRQNDSYTEHSADEVSRWTLFSPGDRSGFHYVDISSTQKMRATR